MANTNIFVTQDDLNAQVSTLNASIQSVKNSGSSSNTSNGSSNSGLTTSDVTNLINQQVPTMANSAALKMALGPAKFYTSLDFNAVAQNMINNTGIYYVYGGNNPGQPAKMPKAAFVRVNSELYNAHGIIEIFGMDNTGSDYVGHVFNKVIRWTEVNAGSTTNNTTTTIQPKDYSTSVTVSGIKFKLYRLQSMVVLSGGGTTNLNNLTSGFSSVIPSGFRPVDKASINVNGKSASSTTSSMGISTVDTDGTFVSSTAQTKNNDMVYNLSGTWVTADVMPV